MIEFEYSYAIAWQKKEIVSYYSQIAATTITLWYSILMLKVFVNQCLELYFLKLY